MKKPLTGNNKNKNGSNFIRKEENIWQDLEGRSNLLAKASTETP